MKGAAVIFPSDRVDSWPPGPGRSCAIWNRSFYHGFEMRDIVPHCGLSLKRNLARNVNFPPSSGSVLAMVSSCGLDAASAFRPAMNAETSVARVAMSASG